MDRERYGRGGGGGGINRYPDVSGRNRQAPPREDRGRGRGQERAPAPAARRSDEPWSDVPPELEAMLRAQVAQRPAGSTAPPATVESTPFDEVLAPETEVAEVVALVDQAETGVDDKPARKPRATRKTAGTTATKAAPKPRATRKTAASASADSGAAETAAADGGAEAAEAVTPAAKPARTRTTRKTATKATVADAGGAADDSANPTVAAPKKRTTRKAAASTEPA